MTKKITVIILFSFLIFINQAIGQTFQRTYGGINNDGGISITPSYDGTLALLSQETELNNNGSLKNNWINIIKIDSAGNIIWKKKIMSQIEKLYGISISATHDSGFIIASNYYTSSTGFYSNLLIIKLNNNGDTTWTKSYTPNGSPNGTFNSIFTNGEIISTSDGGYAFTGTSPSVSPSSASTRMFFLKMDAIGNPVWFKYLNANQSVSCSIKQDSDENYVLCGRCGPGHDKILLVKTNSLGDTLFSRIIERYLSIYPNSMDLANNKGYIISGNGVLVRGFIINLDSLANISWVKSFSGLVVQSVKTIADGYLIVATDTGYVYFNRKLYLLKTDSVGNIIWSKKYGGLASNTGTAILKVSNRLFVLGSTQNFSHGLSDVYLFEPDSNGHLSCNEDSIIVDTSSFSLLSGSGFPIDTGYVVNSSMITVDTSAYQIYDPCFCVPPVAFFQYDSICCPIDFINYSSWFDSCHWDFGDGDTSNLPYAFHPYNSEGLYYVCLTVSNPCGSSTYCDSITASAQGINEESNSKNNLVLFPNPSNGSFQISFHSDIKDGLITITNIVGEVVYSEKFTGNKKMLNCNLNSGIYFIQVTDKSKTWRKKIVIE